jgi:hypothetical protein
MDGPEPTTGLVQPDRTNPPTNASIFNELLLFQWNNNIVRYGREEREGIVQRYWTIIRPLSESGRIVQACWNNKVFTIPQLIAETNLPKSTVYDVLDYLKREKIVIETVFEAVKPNPSSPGPKARVHTYGEIAGLTWEHPMMRKAQKDYESTFIAAPKAETDKSTESRLIEISTEITDYYRKRGLKPTASEIVTHARDRYQGLTGPERISLSTLVNRALKEAGA